MASLETDIALLTDRRYTASVAPDGDDYFANILRDDHLLQAALQRHGLSSIRLDWADPDVDWRKFRCAVFRTTWDYFDRASEFSAWLDRVRAQTRLCNDASIVRWNMDKHYLTDLESNGIPVVQSRYIERGDTTPLHDLLDATGWQEAVFKPCISGAARHTYRVNRTNADELTPMMQRLIADESFILQPFQRNVQLQGEDTLVVLDGQFSHGVRKIPKPGDFRVQDEHGGTVHPLQPTPEQIDLAERAMAAAGQPLAYGRVDMIREDGGNLAIMELELIEPELWLRSHPPSADLFARAIAKVLA